MSAFRRLKYVLLASIVVIASGVPVSALNVQPVIVDLLSSGRRTSTVVTLQNTFASTVPVELTARPLSIVNGVLVESETEAEDLLVFPAQATVGPGQSQAFRVQWVGDPAPAQSHHFFVTVAQLPVQLPENQNAVQILYNFKILVSVGAPDAQAMLGVTSTAVETDETGKMYPVIEVDNTGDTYAYVGQYRMTVVQTSASGDEVFRQSYEPEDIQRRMGLGLVPSGQTRRIPIDIALPQAGGTLSVTLTDVEGR